MNWEGLLSKFPLFAKPHRVPFELTILNINYALRIGAAECIRPALNAYFAGARAPLLTSCRSQI